MRFQAIFITLGCLTLGACDVVLSEPVPQTPSIEQQMLDQITALAAPNQNVQTARLRADDNCYWFSYEGPVETTELPLLTPTNSHICGPEPVIAEVTN